MNLLQTLPIFLIAGLLVGGCAACGGDDDETTESPTASGESDSSLSPTTSAGEQTPILGTPLEVYFARIESITRQADLEQEQIIAELSQAEYDSVEAETAGLREGVGRSADVMEAAIAEIRQVLPPPEVVQEHNALIDNMDKVAQVFNQMYDNMGTVTSSEQLDALFQNYNVAFAEVDAGFDGACEDLQRIADGANIDRQMCGS